MTTVLHLSSSSGPGGAETVVATLAAGLDPLRFRSVVALFRDGWLRRRCEQLGLETHVLELTGMFDVGWLGRFSRRLRDSGVDLIHTHEFGANTYGTLAGRLARVPVIATVHGRNYYADCLHRRLAYRVVSRAAQLVAVSEDIKHFVASRTGVSTNRIRVVHNGIDPTSPVSSEARARLRRDLGIGDSDRIVATVGNLYSVKGHRHLLDAAPSILSKCPSTVFLFAGRGDRELALREQAQALGIGPHIRFLGFREDVPSILAACDVFALPSLSEGLSIAILEAMAAARPVVATRVGGNPELVLHGETGVLVPSGNARELASAVTALLMDPVEARRLGDNARRRVTTQFSVAAMVRRYEAIYDAALSRVTRPRNAPRPPTPDRVGVQG